MKIEFTGRHMDFTPALKAHAEEHFNKIEKVFEPKPPKIHVTIEVERGAHRAEVVVSWWNEVITADASTSDMYQSISQSIAKIEKQARKLKDKVIDRSHKATPTAAVTAPPEEAIA
ncbi:MAG: ribosome-associated translation inhibitor RaiA [Pyrinomonadaceae bacterium]